MTYVSFRLSTLEHRSGSNTYEIVFFFFKFLFLIIFPTITKKGNYEMSTICVGFVWEYCVLKNANPSKITHCSHILWWIFMALCQKGIGVGAHMWPQQRWGEMSSRDLLSSLTSNDKDMYNWSLYPHTLMDFYGAWTKVCLNRSTHVIQLLLGYNDRSHRSAGTYFTHGVILSLPCLVLPRYISSVSFFCVLQLSSNFV